MTILKGFFKRIKSFLKKLIRGKRKKEENKVIEKQPIEEKEKAKEKRAKISEKERFLPDYEPFIYCDNDHWKLFSSVFHKAEREIKIITGSVSDTALFLLLDNVKESVDVKILTGRGRGYENIFLMKNVGMDNIKRCTRLHGKLCIIDGRIMISGSSNLTAGSLGNNRGRSGFLEADFITHDVDIIKSAEYLFEILWNEKSDIDFLKNDSGFITSAFGIPLKIKELVEQAKQEIIIIIPAFLSLPENYISIPKYIRNLNPSVKIKIITGCRMGKDHAVGYEEIKSFENTEIILVKNRIHMKVYMFDTKIAIISSINLTFTSWITSLETGIIITDEILIKAIKNVVSTLEENNVPISIREGEPGDGDKDDSEIIDIVSPAFETEGKFLRDELKLSLVLPKLKCESEEEEKERLSVTPESKTISVPTIRPKISEIPRLKRKRKKKKGPSLRKYRNLRYWTLEQLQRYAKKNDIALVDDKKTLINNIESSQPQTKPRLDFVLNLLEYSPVFSDYVGIIIGDIDLLDMAYKLRERYKNFPIQNFSQFDMNTWSFMSYFILSNSSREFIIDLLEEKLAEKEDDLRKRLEKLLDEKEFLIIFPDEKREKELRSQEIKTLRRVDPLIRVLFYHPELFNRISLDFNLKWKYIRILKRLDYKIPRPSGIPITYLFHRIRRSLTEPIVIEELEKIFESKKDYILNLIENEREKALKRGMKECPSCGAKIKSGKIRCSICNSLYRY